MDARITKQRLSTYLAYDWLKILLAIAAACVAFVVFFTMIGTRPTIGQQYEIFSYGDLRYDEDNATIMETLKEKFSYDILETSIQNFQQSDVGSLALSARRTVLEGNALFVSDYTQEEDGRTGFETVCGSGLINGGSSLEEMGLFFQIPTFLEDTENYLTRFFGENWREGEIDMDEVRTCFLNRNGNDKRFKTDAQKEAGVLLERSRILAIRDNYLFVKENGFDSGVLSVVSYESTNADGEPLNSYPVGINLGRLSGLNKLFYYLDKDGKVSTQEVILLFFNNGDHVTDLKYENLVVLRYLLEKYAPAHS